MSYGKTYATEYAKIIAENLAKLDKDIATRFVLSALSLDSNKIYDAFDVACEEMEIRLNEERKEKKVEYDVQTSELNDEALKYIDEFLSKISKK